MLLQIVPDLSDNEVFSCKEIPHTNSLIKENQPKYNILLKDDKSYPYIVITKEAFPRVESTRQVKKNTGEYFGPYSNIGAQRTLLEFIHKLYPIRTCALNLSPSNLQKGNFKNILIQGEIYFPSLKVTITSLVKVEDG